MTRSFQKIVRPNTLVEEITDKLKETIVSGHNRSWKNYENWRRFIWSWPPVIV